MKALADVVKGDSRLESLKAVRDYTAEALDETGSARDRAALIARLTDVLEQIEALSPNTEEADPLADLVPD